MLVWSCSECGNKVPDNARECGCGSTSLRCRDESFEVREKVAGAQYPKASWSLACANKQNVEQQKTILRKKGVHTDYNEKLEPIFESRHHQKVHSEALGYVNFDGGFGDAQSGKFKD